MKGGDSEDQQIVLWILVELEIVICSKCHHIESIMSVHVVPHC